MPTIPGFKLIDLSTLGGPRSFLSGPNLHILNNHGSVAGYADTTAPNPNPGCVIPFSGPDCFVEHSFVSQKGAIDPLEVLPGGSNGQTVAISASGVIAGGSENGIIDPMASLVEEHAVLWTKDGQITDLGTLAGGTESIAVAVNSSGEVVGFSNNDVPDPFSLAGFAT